MKYKLQQINNNESVGNLFLDTTNDFRFDGQIFYFGSLYSSKVKSISIDGDYMIVITKNSQYTFKKETK